MSPPAPLRSAQHAGRDLGPDVYLAALTIEHDRVSVSTDRGLARFPGLRWRDPLEALG